MNEHATILTNTGETLVFNDALTALLDRTIKAIPETQLTSADDWVPTLDPEVSRDPFTYFGKLREEQGDVIPYIDGNFGDRRIYSPFVSNPDTPVFAVLGYDAIKDMVTDSENFCNAGAYGEHTKVQLTNAITTVNELDGDEHKTVRNLFDRQVFAKHFRSDFTISVIMPAAEHLCDRISAKFDRGEEADLNRDFALPLLYITIGIVVGVPMERISEFVEMGDAAFGGARDPEAAMEAIGKLTEFFTERYEERKSADDLDTGDLMSAMSKASHEGREFSAEEIVIYCRFLLPGGIETTWRQTANLGYAMMLHPDQFQEIVEDHTLISNAVEESIRWQASGFIVPRMSAKDVTLAGTHIPAGSSIMGIFGVANRDPRIWDNPDAFDIHRKRIPHLTFSTGKHACMGQILARPIVTEALRAFVSKLPDMELACDPDEIGTTGFQIRCPSRVPVKRRSD
ncbi:MAG: cytochrome P450 [Parasphingorhabdus sp.]